MFDFLTHEFMMNALLIALALGLSAALLSSFLVLNNQSMIADGLSHVAFTGIIFGLLIFPNAPIYIAIPITMLASVLITYLSNLKSIENDASIGVVSALMLAVGLVTISISDGGFNRDIESLLTGFILSSSSSDVIVAFVVLAILSLFIIFNYRALLSSSYDPIYAEFSKVKNKQLKYILSALTGAFVVIGVKTIGMLLVSSFIIFPSLIASQFAKSFKQNIIISLITAGITVLIGIFVSYNLDLPTGSTIVIVYAVILVIAILYRRVLKIA